eukprot:357586-Chlamydomonas_euryale.AAC.11
MSLVAVLTWRCVRRMHFGMPRRAATLQLRAPEMLHGTHGVWHTTRGALCAEHVWPQRQRLAYCAGRASPACRGRNLCMECVALSWPC